MKLSIFLPLLNQEIKDSIRNFLIENEDFLGQVLAWDEIEVSFSKYSWDDSTRIRLTTEIPYPYDLLLEVATKGVALSSYDGKLIADFSSSKLLNFDFGVDLVITLRAEMPKEDIDLLYALGKASFQLTC